MLTPAAIDWRIASEPAVEVGAVAEVLEHVGRVGERSLPAPGDAFAAHLGEGVGAAVHPGDHVVATDAAERAAAFGHLGRGVVRAAGAVVRHARELRARQGEFAFLGVHPAQHVAHLFAVMEALDAARDHAGDARGGEFVGGGQDPFAAFVVLADDGRAAVIEVAAVRKPEVEVVEQLLHLAFDEAVLLLDHDDVLQAAREVADADRFQRPGHADLVDADAEIGAGASVQAQVFQRLQHVEIALAGGDDAQARIRRIDHGAIDAVGAGEGLRGLHRVAMQTHFLIERRIGPADVQAARRHFEIVRCDDLQCERIHVHGCGGFHRFRDRLEADPAARVARHRPADQAEFEDVLHAGRIEDRHHRAGELAFRAVRQGGRTAGVVIGGQRQHAAVLRGAGGVAVLEHVAAAIHARALAVPHGVDAIDLGTGEQVGLLRAPDHGGAEVFVEAGLEFHAGFGEIFLRPPQFEVEAAKRRAAIAGDEAAGVQAGGLIAQPLHQRQPHQRLHTAEVDAALGAGELVVERVVGIDHAVREQGVGGGGRRQFGGAGHGACSWRRRVERAVGCGKAAILTVGPAFPFSLREIEAASSG